MCIRDRNKYLADCGICSRREADRMIEAGRVTVNGRPADMGERVGSSDEVAVDGRPLERKDKKVVLAFYKPVGVTCTEKDRFAEKTIRDVVDYPVRVTYAGRLDKDSEGLLLLTNDGELINALMRASNYHEKEYLVRVNRPVTDAFLKKMSEGVFLKELDLSLIHISSKRYENRKPKKKGHRKPALNAAFCALSFLFSRFIKSLKAASSKLF